MSLFDLIRTGLKNIWRRRLRSALTIVAVLIGSTAVVALVILAFGAKNVFLSQMEAAGMLNRITVVSSSEDEGRVFGNDEQVVTDDATPLTEQMINDFTKLNHISGVTPVVYAQAFESAHIKDGNGKKFRINLEGIRPHEAFDVNLSAGENLKDNETDIGKIVLGNSYLAKFDIENPADAIGKTLVLTTYPGYQGADFELPSWNSPQEEWEKPKEFEATIVGITAGGPSEGQSIITEAWARKIRTNKHYGEPTKEEQERVEQLNRELGEKAGRTGREISDDEWYQAEPQIIIEDDIAENGFDMIYIQVDNAEFVEEIATDIEETYGVGAVTAKEFLDQILQAFTIVSLILGAIGGIALLVAAVGIINTMVMAVMERTKEIGIMKAVGASKADIRRLFVFEAGLLGFWGGIFGLGSGYGLTLIANYFVNQMMSEEGFAATNIAQVPLWLALGVIAFTTIIGILAGLYPAIRAARMNPVDALRRE